MLKKLLTIVLPIALPFLVYMFYVSLARRGRGASGRIPSLAGSPWPWLGLVGVTLMAAALISYRFVFSDPADAGSTVIPNRYIDGEIQPYQVLEPDEPEEKREPGDLPMPAEGGSP